MRYRDLDGAGQKAVQETLGYLNFSSGGADAKFLANLNNLFALCEAWPKKYKAPWRMLGELLRDGVEALRGSSDAFRQLDQAEAVLGLVFDWALHAYRRHHADLLQHQSEESLFQPYFVGRVFEAVLQQGGPWSQPDRIVPAALRSLNDYLGHRPVAVLRTERKIQPYAHEPVCPIPIYVRGAGAAVGRYRELVEKALLILQSTPPEILFQAYFDPEQLEELAIDPRAYDFDHPNNKRPNYVFGQWDLGQLDLSGRCRRFVVQTITLEAMLEWTNRKHKGTREEAMFEASAVLAGTMLMGSGVSGNRPDAHDSTVTLNTLVQRIAGYRDAFYDWLLAHLAGSHVERLRAEATALRQPFGGVRQHFNQRLAEHRAAQLKNIHLAYVYAMMGQTEAAMLQVHSVDAPSVRMMCDMHCKLTAANRLIDQDLLDEAGAIAPKIEDLLHRAIECGALVDPWNILGFGGQYSLFPSPENSVHDHRVDELIELVSDIFALYVELQKEAAARGIESIAAEAYRGIDRLAAWWDKYATTEVADVEGFSGHETAESAAHVAAALGAWHGAGTAAGDLAFWRGRAEQFRSAKAYAMVVEALLDQADPVAAMALLVQWLSQAEEIGLVEDNHSFHDLVLLWMEDLWKLPAAGAAAPIKPLTAAQRWAQTRKFLDYIEANAEDLWQVPRFDLATPGEAATKDAEQEEEPGDWDELFEAAYENVSYRDSTDDGIEGEMFETGQSPQDFELVLEAERIVARLSFLATIARLWRLAVCASLGDAAALADRDDVLAAWATQAQANYRRLIELLATVHRHRIPPPRGTHESLVEYDRRRGVKEMLLEQIIAAAVETADAGRMIRAAMTRHEPAAEGEAWEKPVVAALHAVLRGDTAAVQGGWRELTDSLLREPLLYVALARGGSPQRVVASRGLQRILCRLLAYLPRLGLLRETYWLLETVQDMEFDHPVGPGAVTEFDQLFEMGCKAMVRSLVESSADWKQPRKAVKPADNALVILMEKATEALLHCWLDHSRGVRLSVLETVTEQHRWTALKRFIERYGRDIFTQRFMILGNLRAILHEGADTWLGALEEEPDSEEAATLLADIGKHVKREDAARWLSLAIEAVVEHYAEYVDYNTTTTQSDRGDMLYTLLDFLRISTSYDRVAWNLRPIALAHEVLVRGGRTDAAAMWRDAVAERTCDIADEHLKRFARLSRKYGMRLPSVSERLGQRFVRPLAIDRLCSLVAPAMDTSGGGDTSEAFDLLQDEIRPFEQEVSGAGFDLPSWLEALEEEVDRIQAEGDDDPDTLDSLLTIPNVKLSLDAARKQIEAIGKEE